MINKTADLPERKNIFTSIRGFFTAPAFEGDKEKTRSAQLLYQIIRVIWALPLLLVTIGILGGRAEVVPPAIVISLGLLTLMVFSRMGRVTLAGTILTAMIVLLIGYADFQNAGNIQPSTLMFAIAIIMSGLLLGKRAPLVTAILILVLHTIIVYFQMQGLIKLSSAPAVGVENIIITSVMVAIIGFLFQFVISRLQSAVDEARKNERELLIGNRELEAGRLSLEQRVADRTHSLELASEVGRSISQVRALDVMLKDASELIRSRFDLYYVQVYLTDSSQTNLLLLSGTGKVGEELLGRGHRLPLNISSINGRAATEKRAVVISDTTANATFRPNPLLPNTRSEMAVPLLVGEKVVGVLDLQSEKANTLNQEILSAFEALAGQLAIAIQNANLLAEADQARAEVEAQARRLVRANWADYQDAIHKPEETGFVFEQNKISVMAQDEAIKENSLVSAISVTGETLGNLVVEMESPDARTAELVDTIARQVAQQIESLRLLESAERYRAESEQASRRLTREGWKNYMDANTGENLSYLYDLKEVRPHAGNGHDESALSVPLKVRDEILGRFAIQGLDPNDSEALELANAVAERLGAHIESLRQADQTQSALAQSEKLFQASSRLTQSENLQDLVLAAVEALDIRAIDRVFLGGFDYAPTGELTGMNIIANWSNRADLPATPVGTHYPKEALSSISLFTGSQPLFVNDMLNDERIDEATQALAKRVNYRSVAALPLYVGSRQDAILLFQGEQPHSFSTEETRLFTSLAPQLATVLENRRQFERAQQQANRESTLNVISQKIQSATSVEAVLQIAARELGHALGAPMTIAQLSMKEKS